MTAHHIQVALLLLVGTPLAWGLYREWVRWFGRG